MSASCGGDWCCNSTWYYKRQKEAKCGSEDQAPIHKMSLRFFTVVTLQCTSLERYGPWVPCCIWSVDFRPFIVLPNSSQQVWPLYFETEQSSPNVMPPMSQGSPSRARYGFNAASLELYQVGRTVAASHAGLLARPDLVPVVAGFGAARATGVVHGSMFTLGSWWEGR